MCFKIKIQTICYTERVIFLVISIKSIRTLLLSRLFNKIMLKILNSQPFPCYNSVKFTEYLFSWICQHVWVISLFPFFEVYVIRVRFNSNIVIFSLQLWSVMINIFTIIWLNKLDKSKVRFDFIEMTRGITLSL